MLYVFFNNTYIADIVEKIIMYYIYTKGLIKIIIKIIK